MISSVVADAPLPQRDHRRPTRGDLTRPGRPRHRRQAHEVVAVGHAMIARLVWRSTPRALLYAAGAQAYLELAHLVTDGDDFMRLLPVARTARPRQVAARRAAVVALWKWCIRNN